MAVKGENQSIVLSSFDAGEPQGPEQQNTHKGALMALILWW